MITFTKEQLIAAAHARIEFAEMMLAGELEPLKERTWSIELALARIALASLEAEAVCVIDQSNLDYLKSGSDADVWPASRTEMGDVLLYRTAPPEPVSVPAAMEMDDDFDSAFEHGKAVGWNACRAAMLQGAGGNIGKPLTIKLPDISSKAFWSGTGKNETFHPETYRRWVKEAIETSCTIARVDVEVK